MPKSLQEYAEWLSGRKLLWPAPPRLSPVKATPYLKPLRGIKAVAWNVYGTLLRIADGQLLHLHPQPLRMQVALEKTIEEFAMWNSMTRKPGAPWEYMLHQVQEIVEEQRMAGTRVKGDVPEVNSAAVWRKIVGRLGKKEYPYDAAELGDEDELSEKIAYFFHASLQGTEAAAGALDTLRSIRDAGFSQGVVADAQCFTVVQLLRAFGAQGRLPTLGDLFTPGCLTLSFQEGIRKPSKTLFRTAAERFGREGVSPDQVLYVGSRLADDLVIARQAGFRTALYAGDGVSLNASSAELRDPNLKPDRLVTELGQVRELLGI